MSIPDGLSRLAKRIQDNSESKARVIANENTLSVDQIKMYTSSGSGYHSTLTYRYGHWLGQAYQNTNPVDANQMIVGKTGKGTTVGS